MMLKDLNKLDLSIWHTFRTWILIIDWFKVATEEQFNILLNQTRVKWRQVGVLVIDAT